MFGAQVLVSPASLLALREQELLLPIVKRSELSGDAFLRNRFGARPIRAAQEVTMVLSVLVFFVAGLAAASRSGERDVERMRHEKAPLIRMRMG